MWPFFFQSHAALVAIATFFERDKLLEHALTASFHCSIQNPSDNCLNSLKHPADKSKGLNPDDRGRASFLLDKSAGERMIKDLRTSCPPFPVCLFERSKHAKTEICGIRW